jgi:hypothetical protein
VFFYGKKFSSEEGNDPSGIRSLTLKNDLRPAYSEKPKSLRPAGTDGRQLQGFSAGQRRSQVCNQFKNNE